MNWATQKAVAVATPIRREREMLGDSLARVYRVAATDEFDDLISRLNQIPDLP
jgi:hypothetical protein